MSDKTKRLLLIFSICLNIGFLVVALYAQYQRVNRPRGSRYLKQFSSSTIFQTVDLNQQQQAEIEQLGRLFQANMLAVSQASAPLKAELFEKMAQDPPLSDEEAKVLIDEMSAIQKKRNELMYQHLNSLRPILTDEQAQKVFARFAEIQNNWAKKIKPKL